MEIITEGLPESNQILIDSIKVTYFQDSDCTESDLGQYISIETRDGGGGKFYHIKTDGWSFDNIDDLVEIFNNFNKLLK